MTNNKIGSLAVSLTNNKGFIHDIPPSHFLIPPTLGITSYLITHKLLGKIFPRQQDNGPFAQFRHRIATVHHLMKRPEPHYYHFIHVDIHDNLHYALFAFSIYASKKENEYLLKNNWLMLFLVFGLYCPLGTKIRRIASLVFFKLAQQISKKTDQADRVIDLFKRFAELIKPTEL